MPCQVDVVVADRRHVVGAESAFGDRSQYTDRERVVAREDRGWWLVFVEQDECGVVGVVFGGPRIDHTRFMAFGRAESTP